MSVSFFKENRLIFQVGQGAEKPRPAEPLQDVREILDTAGFQQAICQTADKAQEKGDDYIATQLCRFEKPEDVKKLGKVKSFMDELAKTLFPQKWNKTTNEWDETMGNASLRWEVLNRIIPVKDTDNLTQLAVKAESYKISYANGVLTFDFEMPPGSKPDTKQYQVLANVDEAAKKTEKQLIKFWEKYLSKRYAKSDESEDSRQEDYEKEDLKATGRKFMQEKREGMIRNASSLKNPEVAKARLHEIAPRWPENIKNALGTALAEVADIYSRAEYNSDTGKILESDQERLTDAQRKMISILHDYLGVKNYNWNWETRSSEENNIIHAIVAALTLV